MPDTLQPKELQLHSLGHEDLPALLALYRQLHPADAPLPPAAEVETLWSDILACHHFLYLGGFIDGKLVTSCTLAIIPNLTRGCRPYALIENVVTDASQRGRGHGTTLLAHAQEQAWQAGCYKVMLMTGRKDPAIQQFYCNAGFDPQAKQAFYTQAPD